MARRRSVAIVTTETTRHATAALLRRLLELVDSGELQAVEPEAALLVRRMEGAVVGLEVGSET